MSAGRVEIKSMARDVEESSVIEPDIDTVEVIVVHGHNVPHAALGQIRFSKTVLTRAPTVISVFIHRMVSAVRLAGHPPPPQPCLQARRAHE